MNILKSLLVNLFLYRFIDYKALMDCEIEIDLTPSLEQTPSYTFLLNLNGHTHLVSGFGPPSLNVTEQYSLASSTVLYNQ